MARPSSGANFNIAQLEQILVDRRHDLNRLLRQRTGLERKLSGLDKQIAKLGGEPGGRRRGPGGRARNEKSLVQTIEEVLGKSGKPMRVGEIYEGVVGTGYKSQSDNPKGIVNQALIKDKRFTQVERGLYQLKK